MEKNISDELQEAFETGRWKVRKFALPNATKYIWDIDNITWAETGLIDAFGANRFFDEASQMIANSIYLFQEGFFDAAFYSLRQSIEISIGTLYLTANPEKLEKWKALEPGFESGKMVCFLKNNEPVFKDSLKTYAQSKRRQISMYINKDFLHFTQHKVILGQIIVKIKYILK